MSLKSFSKYVVLPAVIAFTTGCASLKNKKPNLHLQDLAALYAMKEVDVNGKVGFYHPTPNIARTTGEMKHADDGCYKQETVISFHVIKGTNALFALVESIDSKNRRHIVANQYVGNAEQMSGTTAGGLLTQGNASFKKRNALSGDLASCLAEKFLNTHTNQGQIAFKLKKGGRAKTTEYLHDGKSEKLYFTINQADSTLAILSRTQGKTGQQHEIIWQEQYNLLDENAREIYNQAAKELEKNNKAFRLEAN